jgi:NAD-dependent SIR2 family protein deacetylase
MEHVDLCSCFYCFARFKARDIATWIDDDETALCPHCGMDSVLPDVPLYTLDKNLLDEMHAYFFS